jgi:hypothetical protein
MFLASAGGPGRVEERRDCEFDEYQKQPRGEDWEKSREKRKEERE